MNNSTYCVFVKRLKCCFLGYEIGESALKMNVINPLFLPSSVSIRELVGFRLYATRAKVGVQYQVYYDVTTTPSSHCARTTSYSHQRLLYSSVKTCKTGRCHDSERSKHRIGASSKNPSRYRSTDQMRLMLTCGRSKVKCHCMQLWDGGKRTF